MDLSLRANILYEVQEIFNHKNQFLLDLTFQVIIRITQHLLRKKFNLSRLDKMVSQ